MPLLFLFRKIQLCHRRSTTATASPLLSLPHQAAAAVAALVLAGGMPAGAQEPGPQQGEMIGRLTRYQVKPAAGEDFRKALSDYVSKALAEESNIQAEAYHERDHPSVLWLIERWKNRNELDRFQHSPSAGAIEALKSGALEAAIETHHVTDLEPLSKPQWRRAARTEDKPVTIMLFVDSQEGTQEEFKTIYHTAMPALRGQPGVVTYQLSRIGNEDAKFVTFEKFRSDEAFAAHLDFPPTKTLVEYLQAKSKRQPFQEGLHTLIEFAPLIREAAK